MDAVPRRASAGAAVLWRMQEEVHAALAGHNIQDPTDLNAVEGLGVETMLDFEYVLESDIDSLEISASSKHKLKHFLRNFKHVLVQMLGEQAALMETRAGAAEGVGALSTIQFRMEAIIRMQAIAAALSPHHTLRRSRRIAEGGGRRPPSRRLD